ncbi:hypothetical protein [uncultured Aquimarina sp.]|uniref:hypothetical protein n=1 Tax=uncultured Aquimarina sp. TaxID=575652 RepID=UPI002630E395|nr:hypothetical protein [uncultured Aquimarina sp.]
MLQNILKLEGVTSLNKKLQENIKGGNYFTGSGVLRCRNTSDCRNAPEEGVCIDGYCFT